MHKTLIRWLIIYAINFIIAQVFCRIFSPIACLFVDRTNETDVVKRLDKNVVTLPRDNLKRWVRLFQTHDNNCDEWWYGLYNTSWWNKDWTQDTYDSEPIMRWFCRVLWLQRNTGYGFTYKLFGISKELKPIKTKSRGTEDSGKLWYQLDIYQKYFQLQAQIPTGFNRYITINIGWKAHKLMPNVFYAGRFISFPRKYEAKL